jgi:hypothetical protein
MKKSFILPFLAAILLVTFPQSFAGSSRVAVTAKASTLGFGADVAFKAAPKVNLRLTGQTFDYDTTDTIDDVSYDIELGLESFGAMVDVHPFGGSFHVSGGLLANGNEVDTVANLEPGEFYEIGDEVFTGAELGSLTGAADFDSTAPYVGVGWGNPFTRERRFGFAFDLGVIYQGVPDVSLTAENPFGDPTLDDALLDEINEVEDEFESFEFFPVISVGLSIRI